MEKKTLERECSEYNPEVDLAGSGEKELGHSLADRMIQKYGNIENIPSYKKNFSHKKPIKEIILTSPDIVGKSSNVNFLIKADLKELEKEGYIIKKRYGKMNYTELWNLYIATLKENDYFKQE